ncbi:MAG TPA: hypothetical protein VG899_03185 [Mycobacteriales bacterium]|nr:hypothetical protein [Mycobacteriales bacterium]
MRRIAVPALAMTAVLFGTALTGTAFAAPARTKVVGDCQHAQYKPKTITVFCDQTLILTRISYTSWGRNVAKGADRTFQDNCQPSCAAGKGIFHRDRFTLDRPKTERGVRVFTRVRIYRAGKLFKTYPLSSPTS